MKIVAMIPARLGSTRVKDKNIRLLGNKPLVQYIAESAKKNSIIDEIYINSENDIFDEIAKKLNIKFYKRPEKLSSNEATNDDFALDFINNIDCDILIQLLPTSPFLSSKEINDFIVNMIDNNYDTLISTKEIKIESIYKKNPLNFDPIKHTPPSQLLEPIISYACGIMGWKAKNFISNMKEYGAAYHGAKGKIGFYNLKGLSLIDIDNEEDFQLAELALNLRQNIAKKPKYYSDKKNLVYNSTVSNILKMDGVKNNQQEQANKQVVSIKEILNTKPKNTSWSHTIINSDSNSATLIGQLSGEGNRMHFHPDWNEWWYIIQGSWEWEIDEEKKIINKGEVVFIEKNKKHKITAIGKEMSIRLAVSRYDVDHVYTEDDYKEGFKI